MSKSKAGRKWLAGGVIAASLVAVILLFMRGPKKVELPFNIEPFGSGIGPSAQEPATLFERIKNSGLLSYYVDRNSGAKIDLANMDLQITGNRGSVAWAEGDLKLSIFAVTKGNGGFDLSASLSLSAKEAQLVKLDLKHTKFLLISPRYKWVIDPILTVPPPGVLQDIYVTESGVATSVNASSMAFNSKTREVGDQRISANQEIEKEFMRSYSNAVFGTKYVEVPADVIIRTNYSVDFVKNAVVPFTLSNGQKIQCQITDIDDTFNPPRMSLDVAGENVFSHIKLGSHITIKNALVAVCPVLLESQGDGRAKRLTITVCELSTQKLSASPIRMEFKPVTEREQVSSELPKVIASGTDFHLVPQRVEDASTINRPLRVDYSVTVEKGASLTVAPGTILQFAKNCGVLCQGVLSLAGTRENPIIMEAQSPAAGWGNLTIIGPGKSGPTPSEITIQYCQFRHATGCQMNIANALDTGNDALFFPSSDGERVGGAVAVAGYDSVVLDNCLFEDCSSTRGGAVYGRDLAFLRLSDSTFSRNIARNTDRAGGGAMFAQRSKVILKNCSFDSNKAIGIHASGGGFYFSDCDAEMTGCQFSANAADYVGGAGYMHRILRYGVKPGEPGKPGDPVSPVRRLLEFQTSVFERNQAWCGGGAFFVDEGCEVWLTQNTFSRNQIGISVPGSPPGNRARDRYGGSDVVLFSKSTENQPYLLPPDLSNNTFQDPQPQETSIVRNLITNTVSPTVVTATNAASPAPVPRQTAASP